MSNETKLKPCPFCGESLVLKEDHHGSWWAHKDEPGPCILSIVQLFDESDFADWNRRAAAPSIEPEMVMCPFCQVQMMTDEEVLEDEDEQELLAMGQRLFANAQREAYRRLAVEATDNGELARLEREIATRFSLSWIKAWQNQYVPRGANCWIDARKEKFPEPWIEWCIDYLELRGLLEHHPEDANLVRVKEQSQHE